MFSNGISKCMLRVAANTSSTTKNTTAIPPVRSALAASGQERVESARVAQHCRLYCGRRDVASPPPTAKKELSDIRHC